MVNSGILDVYMNGEFVGLWKRNERGIYSFTYVESWLSSEYARPISLSLPLSKTSHTGESVTSFFDNLLSDNADILNRIRRRYNCRSISSFDLLQEVGRDCAGALQIVKHDEDPGDIRSIKAEKITEKDLSDMLIRGAYNTSALFSDDDSFRISLAGAQEKTAFLYHDNSWCRPLGATPTSHIFKQPLSLFNSAFERNSSSVDNEWLCLRILHAFGLCTAESDIFTYEDVRALVVKRFDREYSENKSWIMRLPQEDFCQALGIKPAQKYENEGGPGMHSVLSLLRSSDYPEMDRDTFFKACLLNWILAAPDGHGKNFSIFIKRNGSFSLTPLYDVISVYPLFSSGKIQRQKLKMAMAVYGKNRHYEWNKITGRHWLETAKREGLHNAEKILTEIADTLEEVISAVENQIPCDFSNEAAELIFSGMRETIKKL